MSAGILQPLHRAAAFGSETTANFYLLSSSFNVMLDSREVYEPCQHGFHGRCTAQPLLLFMTLLHHRCPWASGSMFREVYELCQPGFRGRCTAPLLVDRRQRRLVSNESSDIVRMLNAVAFPGAADVDLVPLQLAPEIDALNDMIYNQVGCIDSGPERGVDVVNEMWWTTLRNPVLGTGACCYRWRRASQARRNLACMPVQPMHGVAQHDEPRVRNRDSHSRRCLWQSLNGASAGEQWRLQIGLRHHAVCVRPSTKGFVRST